MDTQQPDWWTTLRPGDPVILAKNRYLGWRAVHRVERVTKTQLVIANRGLGAPYRFRLADGREVGGTAFHRIDLRPYTEAEAAAICQEHAHAKLLACFRKIVAQDLGGLTVEQCENIMACLKTHRIVQKTEKE